MIEKMEEIKKAKAQIVNGSLTIWNARLDALTSAGNLAGALDHLNRTAESGDNCGCNSGCGAAFRMEDFAREINALKSK